MLYPEFYSSTVYKEDYEKPKKRRQNSYEDEDNNFNVDEENMEGEEDSVRFQKKKKPLR